MMKKNVLQMNIKMTRIELGEQVATLRRLRGMSIRQLAEKSEMNKATITNIEKGKFSPKFETLERLIRELDAEIVIKSNVNG